MKSIHALVLVTMFTVSVAAEPKIGTNGVKFRPQLLYVDTNEGSDVADINGDGLLDITAGRNWFAAPDFAPRPLRAMEEFGADYSQSNGEHALDMNGDGRPDVLSQGFTETQIYWYENPGEPGLTYGKLWKKHVLADKTRSENEAALLHDFDGDGKSDAYIVDSWNPANPTVAWRLTKDGAGNPRAEHQSSSEGISAHGMGVGDIDGDGKEDILIGSGWFKKIESKGDARGNLEYHADWNLEGASIPMLVLDLNADGRNDIIWGKGHNFGLYWMEQLPPKDGKLQFKQHLIDDSFSQPHTMAWADIDGDGSEELITGKRVRAHSGNDPGGKQPPVLYYYKVDRKTMQWTRYLITDKGAGTGLQIRVVDLNKDGKLDIVSAGKSGTYILWNEGR